jgi:hypothetical protein
MSDTPIQDDVSQAVDQSDSGSGSNSGPDSGPDVSKTPPEDPNVNPNPDPAPALSGDVSPSNAQVDPSALSGGQAPAADAAQAMQPDASSPNPTSASDIPVNPNAPFWSKILTGALTALSGGLQGQQQHGRPSFLNGAIGGAQAVQKAQQQATENNLKQQQNTRENQSSTDLHQLRMADGLLANQKVLQNWDAMHPDSQKAIMASWVNTRDTLEASGAKPLTDKPMAEQDAIDAVKNSMRSAASNDPTSTFAYRPLPSLREKGKWDIYKIPNDKVLADTVITRTRPDGSTYPQTVLAGQPISAVVGLHDQDLKMLNEIGVKNQEAKTKSDLDQKREIAVNQQKAADTAAEKKNTSGTGDTSKTGPEYLSSLTPARQTLVENINNGLQAAPNTRTKDGAALAQDVTASHPDYDSTQSPVYLKTRESFTGQGKNAQQVNAGNTTIHHLGRMYDHASQSLTSAGLTGKVTGFLGDQNARNLNTDKTAVGTESAKMYVNGGQTTEGEIHQWQGLIDPTSAGMTTGKIQGNIKEILGLIQGKQSALQSTWESGMPKGAKMPPFQHNGGILSDESLKIIDNIRSGQRPFNGITEDGTPDGKPIQQSKSQGQNQNQGTDPVKANAPAGWSGKTQQDANGNTYYLGNDGKPIGQVRQ